MTCSDAKVFSIKVTPIYGWGWSDGDKTMDVPEPFFIEALKPMEGAYPSIIEGTIKDEYHKFVGYNAYLSKRHTEPLDNAYNATFEANIALENSSEELPERVGGYVTVEFLPTQ